MLCYAPLFEWKIEEERKKIVWEKRKKEKICLYWWTAKCVGLVRQIMYNKMYTRKKKGKKSERCWTHSWLGNHLQAITTNDVVDFLYGNGIERSERTKKRKEKTKQTLDKNVTIIVSASRDCRELSHALITHHSAPYFLFNCEWWYKTCNKNVHFCVCSQNSFFFFVLFLFVIPFRPSPWT